jgi:putative hydrolase of the HAD superfamily
MKFKGILLDLDGTLYDYTAAHVPALTGAVRHIALKAGVREDAVREAILTARGTVHERLKGTAASHNRLLYFQGACERLGVSSFPLALDCYHLYWDTFLDNVKLFDGVLTFLGTFSTTPIILVTDLTADIQHKKIVALGLDPWIKFLVTSEEVGCEKPDPRIFQYALGKLGIKPYEACMIGDDRDKDIAGAQAAGITPLWFDPAGTRNFHDMIGLLNHE